jgi:2-dehydropantoate 2-reductase
MRILVVGAGAVGGYFGARLQQAGRDVTFLVRPKRAEEISATGLHIVSPHGDLTLHPKTVTAGKLAGPYDLILLSVKSYTLPEAMNDFAPALGPETMILPALNGMRHMDLLDERFGRGAVLGGVCMVVTELDEEGRIRQLTDFQSLIYGERDGSNTLRLERVDEALRGAGFDAAVSSHILEDMWQKWVQLATVGAMTCLMRANIGEIASIPGGAELSVSVLGESAAVASACGYPQSQEFLKKMTGQLNNQSSTLTTSTYRDLKKGLPVEVDTILGDLIDRGRKRGVVTPILEAAFVNLSVYGRGRSVPKTVATSLR